MQLTADQVADFYRDGYVIARSFFTTPETDRLFATAIENEAISQHSYGAVDQAGKKSKLALWFTPGDALFLHSNLLHRSDANLSDKPRWSFISAYNLQSNVPFNEKSTSGITPIDIVPDNALLTSEAVGKNSSGEFLSKETDVTLQ